MEIHFTAVSVSPPALAEMAPEIESLGYDSLWSAEIQHDPFIGLSLAAQATEHLPLRTGIAVAFARNPMNMAILANDLQLLSRGRFALGMGSQLRAHITKRFSMPWTQPAARMREYVLAVRAIWESFATGGRLRFRGEFYKHTLHVPFFDPGPNPYGNPPIYLGGVGELMTEAAGEVADGFILHNISTRRFLDEVTLPALRRGRAKAGKAMDGFGLFAAPMVATGEDEREFEASVRRTREQVAFYVATPTYARLLELHGLEGVRDELHRLAAAGRVSEMVDVIDDSVLNTIAFVGEPEDVAARLHKDFGDVITSLSFYEPGTVVPARWVPLMRSLRRIQDAG